MNHALQELTNLIHDNPGRYSSFFFFPINLFIYFWLHWVFVAGCGFLIVVASLVAEHGL